MVPEEIDRVMNLTLDEKVEHSKKIITEIFTKFPPERHYMAWTGGKDSTVMLWLFREACREIKQPLPKAMFIDEGYVFEEIFELVDKVKGEWGVDVAVVKNTDVSDRVQNVGDMVNVEDLSDRNRQELVKLGFNENSEKSFPFEPESYIGNHLMKTVAMNVFLEGNGIGALSTAIRWDEQEARDSEEYFSPRTDPDHIRIHPILHFKERDIWDLIHKHNIPFCSLYYQGYRSLGAKGSTTKNSDIPAWEQDLENTPERAGRGQDKEEVMAQLRSLGYM